jgi:hypothetical protein
MFPQSYPGATHALEVASIQPGGSPSGSPGEVNRTLAFPLLELGTTADAPTVR